MEILTWCLSGVLLATMLASGFFMYQICTDIKSTSQSLDRIENQVEALVDVLTVMAYLAAKDRQLELGDDLEKRAIEAARRLREAEKGRMELPAPAGTEEEEEGKPAPVRPSAIAIPETGVPYCAPEFKPQPKPVETNPQDREGDESGDG